jgi:hypothetical protein
MVSDLPSRAAQPFLGRFQRFVEDYVAISGRGICHHVRQGGRHQNTQVASLCRRGGSPPMEAVESVFSDPCGCTDNKGALMTLRNRSTVSPVHAERSTRSVIVALAALMAVAGILGGCIVETPGHPYHGWWWHHHD